MKFVDEVRIKVKAGDGGRGCMSFRREKFVAKGGPDGGDGGHGGAVYLVVESQLTTLFDYRYNAHYKAKNGMPGLGSNMHGKCGEDLELAVPPGTMVYNEETGELLFELMKPGTRVKVYEGGLGGRGNARFATSTNRAPRYAQPGTPGEAGELRFELKLLADVGLVGLPNAGKSTLISAVSAAKPKISDYPFTTLVPNLGVVQYGGFKTFVMADIPGLIEGASEGHGLGTRFLKHVERTDFFLHCVDLSSLQEGDPLENFDLINAELRKYAPHLADKPQMVALTKTDLPEVQQAAEELQPEFEKRGYKVFSLSAVTRDGVAELISALGQELEKMRQADAGGEDEEGGSSVSEDWSPL